MNKIKILENTLRDGLYIINFLIDSDTIYKFAKQLLYSGVDAIEVGHGLGLGAYKKCNSGFKDEELYPKLAPIMDDHKVFSFFIPELSDIDDTKVARECGLFGIRAGIETSDIHNHYKTLESLKKMGYFVTLNVMKSYSVNEKKFVELVQGLEDIVDVLYLVDSAGTMLPNDISTYFKELNKATSFKEYGFHGHNNLNLAMANSLEAIKYGATYIDTTLGGVGRSGGNVPTESLIALLLKENVIQSEDSLIKILTLSKSFNTFIQDKGYQFTVTQDDRLFGYCGFHSSYEALVREYTKKNGIDFQRFVIELSKNEKVDIENFIRNRSMK